MKIVIVNFMLTVPKELITSATNVGKLFLKGIKIVLIAELSSLQVKFLPLPVKLFLFPVHLSEVNNMNLKQDKIEEKGLFRWTLILIDLRTSEF